MWAVVMAILVWSGIGLAFVVTIMVLMWRNGEDLVVNDLGPIFLIVVFGPVMPGLWLLHIWLERSKKNKS